MVNTSKILTVSYGTFSCTLEGFDDSFDTMKAIAEYFRDLAADDRYFGAEPPTPDAEMLARIAEREIARRVEAHDTDGRIHLRASDTEDTAEHRNSAAMLPVGADVADEATDSSAMSPARDVAEPVHNETAAQDELAEQDEPQITRTQSPLNDTAESVADKLRRIRAVANPGSTAFAESFNEDEHAQDFLTTTARQLDEALAEDDAAEEAQAEPEPEAETPDAPAENAAPVLSDEAESSEPQDVTDEVLAAFSTEPVAEDEAETLETADFDPATSGNDIRALLADEGIAAPAAPAAAPEVEETGIQAEHDIEDLDDPIGTESDEDTLSQLMADAMRHEQASADLADQADGPDAPDTLDTPRVIKMKRSELEQAIAEGGLETDDAEQDDDALLSPDDEADLQRELAEVEAELAAGTPPADVPETEPTGFDTTEDDADELDGAIDGIDEIDDTPHAPAAQAENDEDDMGHAPRPSNTERLVQETDAAETDRMFREADSQLDDSEGTERRSAIQHLRAAVAATKAEKSAGGDITKQADVAPYRLDLEQAVRPRRPVSNGAARAERPGQERPAPLRLVAEQRIDRPTAPVRPRRVSQTDLMADAPADADAAGFADYAEQVGANSLTDLLEAAAAYLSDVEGRDQFSRPMLMHKLREINENGFSREDGLRSFGQLLRQGKLQKLKGGRFTVTDDTDFRQAG